MCLSFRPELYAHTMEPVSMLKQQGASVDER